jgi:hypothetical protein
MPLDARIASLNDRHAALEQRIFQEDLRPKPDSETLARLKREKLRLKEEMERLRASQPPSARPDAGAKPADLPR